MHIHQSKFTHGDIVYLKTDPEQLQRIVTRLFFNPGIVLYELSCGTDVSTHYEIEMTTEIDVNLQLGIQAKKLS
ncbi:hypothetical protein [Pedobacter zeae]|uniref:Uncharacterized protein n=1 Tax=Pedobacter zeae TaxID=1737356 RepID=A0A7W6K9T1_9SPHI|nr:hypothetical protein [Pedobacter zeae]MBB4107742.1 hypothetical protein [Pedobacter zeae]GGG97337.1 hypothetical protein GCM10007422_09120 [Pedobacter zeae]